MTRRFVLFGRTHLRWLVNLLNTQVVALKKAITWVFFFRHFSHSWGQGVPIWRNLSPFFFHSSIYPPTPYIAPMPLILISHTLILYYICNICEGGVCIYSGIPKNASKFFQVQKVKYPSICVQCYFSVCFTFLERQLCTIFFFSFASVMCFDCYLSSHTWHRINALYDTDSTVRLVRPESQWRIRHWLPSLTY